MSVDTRVQSMLSEISDLRAASRVSTADDLLHGGGGGGTSDPMEARVSRLETSVDAVRKDVADIRVDVATLKENVRHLPGKPWMFSTLAGMLAALAVIMGLIVRFIPHS